jgi:hypothetical protein
MILTAGGKFKYFGRISCFGATWLTTDSTWTILGSNPDKRLITRLLINSTYAVVTSSCNNLGRYGLATWTVGSLNLKSVEKDDFHVRRPVVLSIINGIYIYIIMYIFTV